MTDEHHENGWLRKLRGENERRSVSYASITVAIVALGALGGFGVLAMVAGAQKQRIDTMGNRQIEDRSKIDRTDAKVQFILRELRAMQATQEAERRTIRRGRDE